MKNFIKIILGLFALIVVVNIYIWLPLYLEQDEKAGRKLSEVYKNIGENYEFGTHYGVKKICNKDKNIGCLNGELKGIKIINNNEIYLFIYLYRSDVITTYPDGKSEVTKYSYSTLNNNTGFYVSNEIDIPKFGYLNGEELKFYSEEDIKTLDQEKQNIFKELEKKPTVIIDGVDYTK